MSKTFSIRFSALLGAALLVAASATLIARQVSPPAWPALFRQARAVPAPATKAAEVTAATSEVLEQVSRLRGLKVLSPVKSGVKSRQEIERAVIKDFDESATPEEIAAASKTLVAFGLVPKDFRYREFMIRLLTEQVAGFYEPKTKEFFLADWNALDTQKPVMAHELTHALQDQHFNLRRFEKWPKGDADREMAIHALIEGDAMAVMIGYLLQPLKRDITQLPLSALKGLTGQGEVSGMEVLSASPNYIRETLIFPYSYGVIFAQGVVKARGWEGLSRAYTDLPQSTEQVMHFDKYLSGEMPVKVEVADASSWLGAGWRRIERDTNGELGYYLALAEFIGKDQAGEAAAGWGGDQYALYENAAKGQIVLTHLSAWDTPKDAEEFFRAYAQRTRKRYADAMERDGQPPTRHIYATAEGETLIESRGQSVLVIEGATNGSAEKLAAQLWRK